MDLSNLVRSHGPSLDKSATQKPTVSKTGERRPTTTKAVFPKYGSFTFRKTSTLFSRERGIATVKAGPALR
eukprot:1633104-Pleurochrysis_carterae.AAC.6